MENISDNSYLQAFMHNVFFTRILMVLLLLLSTIAAKAQDKTVVVQTGDVTIGSLVSDIERQTNYTFVLDDTLLDLSRTIRIHGGAMSVSEALDRIVAGRNLSYVIRNRYIIINRKPEPPLPPDNESRTGDTYSVSDAAHHAAPVLRPGTEVRIEEQVLKAAIPPGYSDYTELTADSFLQSHQPALALKTNLLGSVGLAPNLGIEIAAGLRSTLDLTVSWNPWNKKETLADYKQLMHWIARAEYRRWNCERFNGHFFGAHALVAKYNVSGHGIPLLFDKQYRYEGYAFGAGISYGYHWAFAPKWGLEFNIGVGVAYMKYDRYDCWLCQTDYTSSNKVYFGPTRAGVSLVFLIR